MVYDYQDPQQVPTQPFVPSNSLFHMLMSQAGNVPQLQPVAANDIYSGIGQGLTNAANIISQSHANKQQQALIAQLIQQQALANQAQAQFYQDQFGDYRFASAPESLQRLKFEDLMKQHETNNVVQALREANPTLSEPQIQLLALNLTGRGASHIADGTADRYNNDKTVQQLAGYHPDLNTPQGNLLTQIISNKNPQNSYQIGSQQQGLRKDTFDANVAEATQQDKVDQSALKTILDKLGIEEKTLTNDEKRALMPYVVQKASNEADAGTLANQDKAMTLSNRQEGMKRLTELLQDPKVLQNPGQYAVEAGRLNALFGGNNPLGTIQQTQKTFIGGKPGRLNAGSYVKFNQQYPAGGTQTAPAPTPTIAPVNNPAPTNAPQGPGIFQQLITGVRNLIPAQTQPTPQPRVNPVPVSSGWNTKPRTFDQVSLPFRQWLFNNTHFYDLPNQQRNGLGQ